MIGKWSEILLVIMAVSNMDDLGVGMTWSMRVALERVHLVGFVTVCSKPKEKSKSINSNKSIKCGVCCLTTGTWRDLAVTHGEWAGKYSSRYCYKT
jgi:hypothetical protein